ncbi:MAG: Cas10/Cmr2 second palm domain-containing protein [Hominimerdicola sp.]
MNLNNENKYIEQVVRYCTYLYSQNESTKHNASEYAKKIKEFLLNDKDTKYDELSKQIPDIKIRILKGGSYKIKEYYLENYNLNDIRGASNLLSYVEEDVIPQKIKDGFTDDSVIYCGGGNVLAILPENADANFALELEKTAQEILITAQTAFIITEPISIRDIFSSRYKETMHNIESLLDKRKKVKIINNVNTESKLIGKELSTTNAKKITIKGKKISGNKTEICDGCRIRKALYEKDERLLCGGCLHKASVGKEVRTGYIEQYKKYTGHEPKKISCLSELGEDIAVVYGDGNNMGGIVHNLNKIIDMMQFSENVKTVANKSVFQAMGEVGIDKFEVVGLGGDDVFVIVSGNKAFEFSVRLARIYGDLFKEMYKKDTSTMSVGIAIGKNDTPVKILLEQAEDKLEDAKHYSKTRTDTDDGSISFTVLTGYEGNSETITKNGSENTLLPYSVANAERIIDYIKKIKDKAGKTRLRNILDSYRNAESVEEADLFFDYINAKEEKAEKRIKLNKLDGYEIKSSRYTKNDKSYFIWKDILELYDNDFENKLKEDEKND